MDLDFITNNGKLLNELDRSDLTRKGLIGSEINECNEILLTEIIEHDILDNLSVEEICGVLGVFIESTEEVKNRFEKEANLVNIKIKKVSENKFKVYFGPYASFNSMKETYFSLNELGFEDLDIINTNK